MIVSQLTQSIVRELIEYQPETGKMFWKNRKPNWFKTEMAWRRFNSAMEGKELNPNYLQAKVLGSTQQKSRLVWLMHTGSVPNGDKFKIMTFNRDRFDTRIENLVCVPTTISVRQKLDEASVASSTGRYGVYWIPSKSAYSGDFVEISGKRTTKYFKTFDEAFWFRYSHEPMHNYKDMDEFTTGDKLSNEFIPLEFSTDHEFDEVVYSEEHRKNMSIAASRNHGTKGNNYRGTTVGTHLITGEEVRYDGSREIELAGFSSANVYRAIRLPNRTAYGYKWRRETNEE